MIRITIEIDDPQGLPRRKLVMVEDPGEISSTAMGILLGHVVEGIADYLGQADSIRQVLDELEMHLDEAGKMPKQEGS